ncbi:acetate/propionate family kinase [candidate division KSB1 bacterium]|nr:acetate/propionate family kinase [candidate division KSB1 bacterium]
MYVIVCNIGSSSFKFQLLDMASEIQIARGYIERVGSDNAIITYWHKNEAVLSDELPMPTHREAVQHSLDFLTDKAHHILESLDQIDGIGFKCIQAGEKNGSVLLSQDVLDAMEYYRELAPAHNPPYLTAIYMFRDLLPKTSLVGVFEPGFHIHTPDYAKVYGTPYEWIEKYGIKKYGYHGASHRFVTWQTVKILGLPKDNHKIITCHLGGSSSLCAFKNGISIDTSMGFTPQSGLIQGTRIGDMDPYVLPYIMDKKGISLDDALKECSKNSGLAGLSGTSGDMRDIKEKIEQGDKRALLARNKFIYDIKRYIGEFLVMLEGLDAITFTGGIGQRDADLRKQVLSSLSFLGLRLDHAKNDAGDQIITTEDSAIRALVLETNEEIVVARETVNVITGK